MNFLENKRAVSPITVFFYLLTFYILFFLFLGSWLSTWGHNTVTINNLIGFEAFFFDNIIMVPIIASILFAMAYGFFGGSQR